MSMINSFVDDLNKSVLNGLNVGENKLQNIISTAAIDTNRGITNGVINLNKNITNVQSNVKYALRNIDNDINKSIDDSIKFIYKNRDTGLLKKADKAIKDYAKIEDKVKRTTNNTVNKYKSSLDGVYVWLFKTLIKPYDRKAIMRYKDYNFITIITTFIFLVVTTTNNYIVDNTFLKVKAKVERLIGYRFDGRKIGKWKYKEPKKIPLIMKIIKTILLMIAAFLDLILMAFLNQTDVFATMVKDLLGK